MPVGLQPKPSDADIAIELRRHRGYLQRTAKALGCTSIYVRRRIAESTEVQEAYRDSRDEMVDLAEDVMHQRLQEGSESAAKFVLATLGKDRGYVERMEHTGKGGGSISVTLNLGRQQMNFDQEIPPPEDLSDLDSYTDPMDMDYADITEE
jgi:hypothetical protein